MLRPASAYEFCAHDATLGGRILGFDKKTCKFTRYLGACDAHGSMNATLATEASRFKKFQLRFVIAESRTSVKIAEMSTAPGPGISSYGKKIKTYGCLAGVGGRAKSLWN